MKYTQKALVLLVGVVLLLGAFHFSVYRPKSAHLADLQKEEKDLDKKIADLQVKKAKLPRIEEEIKIARRQLSRLKEQYPKTIESIYQAINSAAEEVGFEILKTEMRENPKMAGGKTAVKEYEIAIQARSPYRALGDFIYEITNSPVAISVSGLKIVRGDMKVSEFDKVPELDIELSLTAYLTKED